MPAAAMTWGMAPAQQPTAEPKAANTIMTAARGVWRFIICVGRMDYQPLPMKGILVAITVMNCTFDSSGREAMKTTERATS